MNSQTLTESFAVQNGFVIFFAYNVRTSQWYVCIKLLLGHGLNIELDLEIPSYRYSRFEGPGRIILRPTDAIAINANYS